MELEVERVKGNFFFVTPNFFRKEPSSSILSFTKILVCCSQGLSALSRKQIKTHDIKNDFPISIIKMVLQPFDFYPYKYLKDSMTGRATVFPFFSFCYFLCWKNARTRFDLLSAHSENGPIVTSLTTNRRKFRFCSDQYSLQVRITRNGFGC